MDEELVTFQEAFDRGFSGSSLRRDNEFIVKEMFYEENPNDRNIQGISPIPNNLGMYDGNEYIKMSSLVHPGPNTVIINSHGFEPIYVALISGNLDENYSGYVIQKNVYVGTNSFDLPVQLTDTSNGGTRNSSTGEGVSLYGNTYVEEFTYGGVYLGGFYASRGAYIDIYPH